MNAVVCGNSTRGGGVMRYSGRHANCFCMPGWLRWAHIADHSDVRISQCPHITSTDFPEGQFWKWLRASCRDAYFKSHFFTNDDKFELSGVLTRSPPSITRHQRSWHLPARSSTMSFLHLDKTRNLRIEFAFLFGLANDLSSY